MNVVSFFVPRPEHPFYQDYKPYLALLRESCERYGHRHIVLTDDPDLADDGYVVPDTPRSLMKAFLWCQFRYLSDPQFANEPTLLTGADCVLANDPACFASFGTDLVITTGDFADCRMNCGAIYMPRPTLLRGVWQEAYDWLCATGDEWGDDQRAIYRSVLRAQKNGLSVTDLSVDPYNLAPDNPHEDCTRGVVVHFRGPRKRWMADYCHIWFGIGEGIRQEILPPIPDEEMAKNVRINVRAGMREVAAHAAHSGHAVLVGGGPSLADTFPEIKRRASDGQTIFALNGAAKWLQERGFIADYGVIMDPRPENISFLDGRVDRWLLASQCDPALVQEAIRRSLKPQVWHFRDSAATAAVGTTHVGGGVTVGLTAMGLVYSMGYRKMHLYGYDSSHRDLKGHAYHQVQALANQSVIEVWAAGQPFVTSLGMFAQARAFERWADALVGAGCLITVHGDGLLPTIARNMARYVPVEEHMAA